MSREKKQTLAGKRFRKTRIKLFIFLFLYAAFLVTGYIFSLYLSTFVWFGNESIYPALHFIQDNGKMLAVIGGLLGILVILFWDYLKMYQLVETEVQRATAHAEEAEQRKNDLVVYLAHDLKTPLTSVLGYLQLLQDEPGLPQDIRIRYMDVAYHKAERLEDLINEFFEITRYNLTHITLEKSEINLTRMLEQTIFEFQPMMQEKELTCQMDAPKDYMFLCDPDRMQRVFDNLIRNAIYYSFPSTSIQIRLHQVKDQVILDFENEGNTIPEEKLSRIFEQFFRLDTSRGTKTGGSGVGLAIAKEIVELHGGQIFAESANNRICFHIILISEKVRKS